MVHIYKEIPPTRVTGVARAAIADEDQLINQFKWSRWFDRELTPSIRYEFDLGTDRTFSEAARFRAFDTGPRAGRRPGVSKVSGSLPPIGIQYPITEMDQIEMQAAGNDSLVADLLLPVVEQDVVNGVQAVERRFEFMRRDLLVGGQAVLQESGIRLDVSTDRNPARALTVAIGWDVPGTADPIGNERFVVDTMSDNEFIEPNQMVAMMNRVTWRAWKETQQVRELWDTVRVRPDMGITDGNAAQIRRDMELPPVELYDAQALNPHTGLMEKMLPDWVVVYLPNFVIGRTQYGIPSMANDSDLEIPFSQRPGPLAYIDKSYTPLNYSTVIDALGMALLKDPDATFALTVKP